MATTAVLQRKGGVEFNCLGGSVQIRHGYKTDENTGQMVKMYFSRADIEKMKVPEKFLAKRKDGMEIGIIELDMNKRRKMVVPYYEDEMIELLKSNELVSKARSGQKLTNKVMWFDPEENRIERKESTQTKQLALLAIHALPKRDIMDISCCLGMREVDSISDPDFADIIEKTPKRIMDLIEIDMKFGNPKGKLLESTRVEAILRRAITARIVTEKAGALYFADEQLGTDFRNALKNLQNKTKGDEASMNHVLPLIRAKLGDSDADDK